MAQTQPNGYLGTPASGTGPGVLVLHAWWGLNDTIKSVCTRLADAGFVAFAPDLYHGEVADTIAGAEALAGALSEDFQHTRAEIAEAARHLSERADTTGRDLAVIGFSLGANYALDLAPAAPDRIRSVVIFYGTGTDEHGDSQAAYLGHFAENDPYEPLDGVAHLENSLKQVGRPVTFYRYPGVGHWFFEPDRTDAYDEAAANLAWERTLEFLKRA